MFAAGVFFKNYFMCSILYVIICSKKKNAGALLSPKWATAWSVRWQQVRIMCLFCGGLWIPMFGLLAVHKLKSLMKTMGGSWHFAPGIWISSFGFATQEHVLTLTLGSELSPWIKRRCRAMDYKCNGCGEEGCLCVMKNDTQCCGPDEQRTNNHPKCWTQYHCTWQAYYGRCCEHAPIRNCLEDDKL